MRRLQIAPFSGIVGIGIHEVNSDGSMPPGSMLIAIPPQVPKHLRGQVNKSNYMQHYDEVKLETERIAAKIHKLLEDDEK